MCHKCREDHYLGIGTVWDKLKISYNMIWICWYRQKLCVIHSVSLFVYREEIVCAIGRIYSIKLLYSMCRFKSVSLKKSVLKVPAYYLGIEI